MRKKTVLSLLACAFLSVTSFCLVGNDVSGKGATKSRHLTAPMCEILGMLNEYISRFDYYTFEPHPGQIEIFYPNELRHMELFEKLLAEHAEITGLRKGWKKETGRQGHVTFMSKAWADVINSFYARVGTRYSESKDLQKRWATLDPEIFMGASRENMLRFLRGAYSRFGSLDKSSAIMIANAPYKIQTIAGVLRRLGCSDVKVYVLPSLPHQFQVHFSPSPEVRDNLGIQKTVLVPEENFPGGDWRFFKKID